MSKLFTIEVNKGYRTVMDYQGKFGDYWKCDAEKKIDKINDATIVDGVVRWKSNNSVPPKDLLTLWYMAGKEFDFDKTIEASDKDDEKFFKNYRKAMKNHVPSEEELAEMKNAFGEGSTVVNVITGQSYNL